MNSIFHRISVRKYEDRPVEKEKIMEILRAGMQAPSACNQQPWEFYVVTDKEKIQKLSKVTPYTGPGLHGRTQQRPVKGATQAVWSLSGTAGGNGFQQILPAQGRADGLGAVVAPGRRAEGGQSFFFYVHALTVGSASFRVKTPFPAVHPGAGRRFLPASRAGGAHFPASLRLVSRRAANSSKGTVPSRQKLTQFFLFIW